MLRAAKKPEPAPVKNVFLPFVLPSDAEQKLDEICEQIRQYCARTVHSHMDARKQAVASWTKIKSGAKTPRTKERQVDNLRQSGALDLQPATAEQLAPAREEMLQRLDLLERFSASLRQTIALASKLEAMGRWLNMQQASDPKRSRLSALEMLCGAIGWLGTLATWEIFYWEAFLRVPLLWRGLHPRDTAKKHIIRILGFFGGGDRATAEALCLADPTVWPGAERQTRRRFRKTGAGNPADSVDVQAQTLERLKDNVKKTRKRLDV